MPLFGKTKSYASRGKKSVASTQESPTSTETDSASNSSTLHKKTKEMPSSKSSASVSASTTAKTKNKYSDELEVEYDMNPTLLYKLIEGKDWDAAITRVEKAPLEANTWVARYEAGDASKLRWRLLPLHACCIFRAPVALLEALLRAFPDGAQMKDDQGMLPVHLACRNGASKGVVMMLLDAFPESVSLKDRKGRTPLMFTESSSSQNREAVIIGIRKFIQDYNNNTQTTPANYNSRSAVAAQSAANEVDYEHRTVLFRLILKKDWENAGLRAKSSPDEASTWIVTKGFKGNLRFLPLHKACVLSPPESVVESLVAAFPEGAKSKDQDGWLPIHCACFYGASQGAIDTLLVAYPKGSQSKDDEGRLPIHYACLKGASTGVVESLLGTFPKGAQSKDDEGRLPIHHACSKGAPEGVITALLNSSPKGAQSKDDQGRLPIHHACRKNCSEKVIKALLKTYPKGAQVKDDQDKLPIHYVCQNGGSEDVINVLLAAYPFSINVKNGFGYTPLAEAKAMDNPKMEKVVATLEKFISNNPHLTSQGEEKAFQAAEDSSKRAMKAERVAAEAHEDQQVLMAKVADLEATVGQLQRQLDFLAQVGSEMKSSLAEGVTARECLETFGEKLMNINKISS